MHKTIGEAVDFARKFIPLVKDSAHVDKAVAPPFTALKALADALKGTGVIVAAQNMHSEPKGAFTGEVSAEMIKDAGATCAIIGHSERRQYFHETDEMLNKKAKAALAAGLGVIFCIGETIEQRQAGRTFDILKGQVSGGLTGITDFSNVAIAYEPVWAIGTGLTATPEQAQESHAFIRATLRELFGEGAADMRILYGGSVKPDNIASLMERPDVDGALVGGASLDAESFAKIVNYKRG
jgi:triosephosphate isomerase